MAHHREEMWYSKFPYSSLKTNSKSPFFPTLGLAIVAKNKNPAMSGTALDRTAFFILKPIKIG